MIPAIDMTVTQVFWGLMDGEHILGLQFADPRLNFVPISGESVGKSENRGWQSLFISSPALAEQIWVRPADGREFRSMTDDPQILAYAKEFRAAVMGWSDVFVDGKFVERPVDSSFISQPISQHSMSIQPTPVSLTIHGETPLKDLYQFWWLVYVKDFNPKVHCQDCLLGTKVQPNRKVRLEMPLNTEIVLDEDTKYKHLYLCGVSRGQVYANNFHLAMERSAGGTIDVPMWKGNRVTVQNARQLPIPPLEDGFGGKTPEFTTCRNWQFGVAYYPDRWKEFLESNPPKS